MATSISVIRFNFYKFVIDNLFLLIYYAQNSMLKQKLNLHHIVLYAFIVCAVFCFCTKAPDAPKFDNPQDKNNPDYVPPKVFITSGPKDNDTLHTSDTTFTWTGNTGVMEYAYKVDNDHWAQWSVNKFCNLADLAEGKNTFYLKGRYATGDESVAPDSVVFYVDAVQGPALLFRPPQREFYVHEEALIEVMADEITDLMFVNMAICYDTAALEIKDVMAGPFLGSAKGNVVSFYSLAKDTLKAGVGVAALGHAPGVNGSGIVIGIKILIRRTGSPELRFIPAGCSFRTPDQKIVHIREFNSCTMTIP